MVEVTEMVFVNLVVFVRGNVTVYGPIAGGTGVNRLGGVNVAWGVINVRVKKEFVITKLSLGPSERVNTVVAV